MEMNGGNYNMHYTLDKRRKDIFINGMEMYAIFENSEPYREKFVVMKMPFLFLSKV